MIGASVDFVSNSTTSTEAWFDDVDARLHGEITTIASGSPSTLWSASNLWIDWTGTSTLTTANIPNAPQAGAERILKCAGAAQFTADANMLIQGYVSGATFTAAANDLVKVFAVTTTQFLLTIIQYTPFGMGTAIATTTGTSHTFTDIPSAAKIITVSFVGVSLSGTNDIIVRIGSGSVTSSGYLSTGAIVLTTPSLKSSSSAFLINTAANSDVYSGHMTITKVSDFVYAQSHTLKSTTTAVQVGGGNVSLSGALDRVVILASGSDTFDLGSVNITWE